MLSYPSLYLSDDVRNPVFNPPFSNRIFFMAGPLFGILYGMTDCLSLPYLSMSRYALFLDENY